MTRSPCIRAALTKRRKLGFISGAPPVRSSVCNRLSLREIEHHDHGVPAHFLRPLRAGRDVAMKTGLVAAITQIRLERFELAAPDSGKFGVDQ